MCRLAIQPWLLIIALLLGGMRPPAARATEDLNRPLLPEFKVDYWGSDLKGLTWQELRGHYGVLLLQPVYKQASVADQNTNEVHIQITQMQEWAQTHCTAHGFYFQILSEQDPGTYSNEAELRRMAAAWQMEVPIASVALNYWDAVELRSLKIENGRIRTGCFLIDPYGRIVARTPKQQTAYEDSLAMPPVEQLQRELAEYWLEQSAKDLIKADKAYTQKKWQAAFAIYQPLADKVQGTAAGKLVVTRANEIAAGVQREMAQALSGLTLEAFADGMKTLRKLESDFKGTLLGTQAAAYAETVKRVKTDSVALSILRMAGANVLARLHETTAAQAAYQALADAHAGQNGILSELQHRKTADVTAPPFTPATPDVWVQAAQELLTQVEQLGHLTNAAAKNTALSLTLGALERCEAAFAASPREITGLLDQIRLLREKLFWIDSQS